MPDILCDPRGRAEQRFHRPRGGGGASAALAGVVALMSVPVWLSVGYAVSPAGSPGGATPQFWTPTTPPTNCRPEAPWGGGGGGGLGGGGLGGAPGRAVPGGGGGRFPGFPWGGGGGVGHLGTVGYAAQV